MSLWAAASMGFIFGVLLISLCFIQLTLMNRYDSLLEAMREVAVDTDEAMKTSREITESVDKGMEKEDVGTT